MKKIALLMVLVLTVALFAGCSGSDSGAAGTYELVSIKEDDMNMSGEDLKAFGEMMGVKGSLITMELTSDGKAKITSSFMEEVAGEGTYTLDGNKITVTIDNSPISGTVDGGKITLSDENLEMVFEKQ